jgi:hypothetical protein
VTGDPAGRPWLSMSPRDFDGEAEDTQMSLFSPPDSLGQYGELFSADAGPGDDAR